MHSYCSKAPSSSYLVMASRWFRGKEPPAMQENRGRSLGWEDPLKEAWQPTPVFLPGGLHGQRSLASYNPWGNKQSDTTQATKQACWLTIQKINLSIKTRVVLKQSEY